jgi:hypothetical protein
MKASDVLDLLPPLDLIVRGRGVSNAASVIDEIGAMRAKGDWDGLGPMAHTCDGMATSDALYPELLLHLADAYRQAGSLARAEVYCAKAVAVLQTRTSAVSMQNRAVAVYSRGLIVHFMDRAAEAANLYDQASGEFKHATAAWELENPTSPRVGESGRAAKLLSEVAGQVVTTIGRSDGETGGKASVALQTQEPADAWQPDIRPPVPPLDPPYVPPAEPVSLVDLTFVALAVVCFSLLTGVVTFVLGGTTALLVFTVILAGTAAAAIVLGRASTGGGFWLQVPYDHVAVVEEGDQPLLVGEVKRWALVPWSRRLRALVPLRELTYALPEERVCLGKKPQDDECQYAALTMRVRYRVVDPVEASYHFVRAAGFNGDAKAALSSKDLVQNWESQLSVDVAPVLVDDLWGATVGACLTHRLRIQENVRRGLATRTRRWGVDVTDVTLLDVIPSSP